jgi:hypothetical protein
MTSFTARLESLAGRFRAADAQALHTAGEALLADARAAGTLRAYQNDPAVAALRIERTRDVLDRFGWAAIVAGLLFTTVNVANFINAGFVGWLVEPMIMGLLLVLLRGEQIAARYSEPSGSWVIGTRRGALVATYVMNTWESWGTLVPAQIIIHSLPPIAVFCAAEALAQQRATLTKIAAMIAGVAWGAHHQPIEMNAPAGLLHVDVAPTPVRPVFREPITVELPVPVLRKAPERAPEPPQAPGVPEVGENGRRPRGAVKEALERAFAELAVHTDYREIRPVDVDTKAGLEKGTAKRKINDLRAAYARETVMKEVAPDGEVINVGQ